MNFQQYFLSDLGVPQHQITLLCDEQATRDNIINALHALADDRRIRSSDSVFIFYAGHGTMAQLPPSWKTSDLLCHVLVPYDFNNSDEHRDFMGITDYALGALLRRIENNTGSNIVRQ